ncbi:MAG: hypothetical protein ACTSU2_17130 [Promethearchaeota archaeon]
MLEIPQSIGELKNLRRVLDLSYNRLIKVPQTIGALEKLETLFLEENNLNDIPSTIINLKNLHEISLKFNPIPASTQLMMTKIFKKLKKIA